MMVVMVSSSGQRRSSSESGRWRTRRGDTGGQSRADIGIRERFASQVFRNLLCRLALVVGAE
jgi:hypothetical protein